MKLSLAPVALFVYNRPNHTRQTLDALAANAEAKESKLYVFCDGPKLDSPQKSQEEIRLVRQFVKSEKRFGEVEVIERENNKGLASSIIEGVGEILSKHGKVIVLEDDLVTSRGFLKYMNEALRIYEGEKQVMHISAYMFPVKGKLPETFFYKQTSCWGWATWADRWGKLESNAIRLHERLENTGKLWTEIDGTDKFVRQLNDNIKGVLKTWSVYWQFSVVLHDGLCLHPGKSLVRNIGLDDSGTNCEVTDMFEVELAPSIAVKKIPVRDYKPVYGLLRNFYGVPENKKRSFKLTIKEVIKGILPNSLFQRIKTALRSAPNKQREDGTKRLARYTKAEINFLDRKIKIADIDSFEFMGKEIFESEIYKFASESRSPYIIDCGANIGLSVIYFKKLFPASQIVAFEPDEEIFEILKHNIKAFGLSNVELIKKACWNSETTLSFFKEGADAGRAARGFDKNNLTQVKTARLRDYLNKPVDLLKIDIEGAEYEVINDISDVLNLVANIFVEYHSFIGQEQKLPELLAGLKKAGFRLFVSSPGYAGQPFIQFPSYLHMDNQVNIFGVRP